MKITPKTLSIIPYLSTSWENISSLHVREESGAFRLIVIMKDGSQAEAPGLDHEAIATIFDAHSKYAENKSPSSSLAGEHGPDFPNPLELSFPLKTDKGILEAFGQQTQHNPEQANLPPLPSGILKKITAIAKVMGLEDVPLLPKGEPGCNCIYCQVINALHDQAPEKPEAVEEEISNEDLKFRNWDVTQTSDKLYTVTNPLDANEHYSVFLGNPLGCTCGSKNCEHIRAVLHT